MPKFHLADEYAGKLAHVGVNRSGGQREVCISDEESTAVNTDRPELVYLETVRKHVALLTRLIENPAYNRAEQLREFEAHWEILCRKERKELNEIFVAWDGHGAEDLQVRPPRTDSGHGPAEDVRSRWQEHWPTTSSWRRCAKSRNGSRGRRSGKGLACH